MMKRIMLCAALAAALGTMIDASGHVNADELITDYDNFTSDGLFGSWSSAAIVSGPTSYDITATGYGSNYKYIGGNGIVGAGYTTVELTVTLEGPQAADGQLGPLVQLIDGDGTHYHYRWYGQLLGNNVLTRDVESPDFVGSAGTTPGLNLNDLQHMHMELDPGGFGTSGAYTVKWENLELTNFVPEPSSLLLLTSAFGLFMGLRRR